MAGTSLGRSGRKSFLRGFKGLPALPRQLGKRRRARSVLRRKPRQVRTRPPYSYDAIREQVLDAISRLSPLDQARIPTGGTLPELIVAYCLVKAHMEFLAQHPVVGGKLHLGGSVVDFLVRLGSQTVVVRVQGDYWHSLPDRRRKDSVQFDRLKAQRFLVADLWEHDLYQAWASGQAVAMVRRAVENAL